MSIVTNLWIYVFKKTQRHYIFCFFLTLRNKKNSVFIIVCDFRSTENQTKSCPRRYLKSPQKESWEVPKTIKKPCLKNKNKNDKHKLKRTRFLVPPLSPLVLTWMIQNDFVHKKNIFCTRHFLNRFLEWFLSTRRHRK